MEHDEIKQSLLKELQKAVPDFDAVGDLTSRLMSEDDQAMRFSVDAKHIHRLGFELVGKQETAVSELVKNSYDADASLVEISVSDYDEPGGTLTISDDGIGMTESDIRNKWMMLSTNDKEDNPVSPIYGRSRAGRKGIGRFATERLGSALILESRTKGDSLGIRVTFEWDENYTSGKFLSNIGNPITRFEKSKEEHGTTLTITHLREKWTDRHFERIWKSLLLLQSPFLGQKSYRKSGNGANYATDPGFQVVINGDKDVDKAAGISIESNFLQHRTALITGKVDGNGKAKFSVKSDVLNIDDEHEAEDSFLLTGQLEFETHYFIYLSELMSGIAVNTAKKMGHSHGGMRIYRDGFRVMPYGENHDDWLHLSRDSARRGVLVPINNPNVFGHVEIISSENVLFEETASREGFIENEAFEELRSFVRQGIEWGVTRIASARGRKRSASEKDFVSSVRKPSEVIDDLADGEELNEDALTQARILAKEYEDAVEKKLLENLEYEELLRILASLGISISVFSHEIIGALNQVKATIANLKKEIGNDVYEDNFMVIGNSTDRLGSIALYIMDLISYTSSREKKRIALSAVIENFTEQFKSYLNTRKIELTYEVNPDFLRTKPMHQSEIDSVLFNFLTNSVKAMDRANIANQCISIRAQEEGGYAVIEFQDTGKGVPENIKERIFDKFFTTSDHHRDEIAGPGIGLGLKIVADIAASNNGFVELAEPDGNFGCCFKFGVPVSSQQSKGT